jgi:hypothetical protein
MWLTQPPLHTQVRARLGLVPSGVVARRAVFKLRM